MMVSNVRVVANIHPRASAAEKYREFKRILNIFRKVVDTGVINQWKQKQFFESKGEKKRRKRKENAILRRKEERGGR